MVTYNNIELFVYCATKTDFERELSSGNVSASQIGIIAETAEFWSNGAYYPLVHLKNVVEVSPAEFTFRPSAGAKSIRDESAVIRRIKGNTSVWGQLAKYYPTLDIDEDVIVYQSVTSTTWWSITEKISVTKGHKYLLLLNALNGNYSATDNYALMGGSVRINIGTPVFYTATSTDMLQTSIRLTPASNGLRMQAQYFDLTAIFGTGNEPSTIEQFKEYYPESYYPYCAPVIRSMRATGIETIGSNAFDKETVMRGKLNADGSVTTNDKYSVAKIEVVPNEKYTLTNVANAYNSDFTYALYDSNDTFLSIGQLTYNSATVVTRTGDVTMPSNARYMRVVVHNNYLDSCCVNLKHSGTITAEEATYFKEVRMLPDIAKYFPDGMHGVGDVYDEINLDNAIKRIGVRPYEDGDGDNMYARTDGTTTVYVLEEPIVTPIVEPLQLYYKVADFGTEKMISTLPSSPFRADIVYAFNAVDRIRDNARNIEKLEDIMYPLLNEELATKSFVIDTIPTEIATATQRIEILQDFVPPNLIANVLYDWGSTTKVSVAIPHLATDNSNYDNKWMVRFALLSSDNLTIPFEVFWKDGIAPSWNEWCVCDITFFKDITGERTFGEWKIYK